MTGNVDDKVFDAKIFDAKIFDDKIFGGPILWDCKGPTNQLKEVMMGYGVGLLG